MIKPFDYVEVDKILDEIFEECKKEYTCDFKLVTFEDITQDIRLYFSKRIGIFNNYFAKSEKSLKEFLGWWAKRQLKITFNYYKHRNAKEIDVQNLGRELSEKYFLTKPKKVSIIRYNYE